MSSDRTEIDGLMQQIETSWKYWDSLFTRLDKKKWRNKHEKDWVFEDVPFHLAYCERDLVAYPIEH